MTANEPIQMNTNPPLEMEVFRDTGWFVTQKTGRSARSTSAGTPQSTLFRSRYFQFPLALVRKTMSNGQKVGLFFKIK